MECYTKELIRGYLHPCIGQEAVAVGVCGALEPEDTINSTHRGHGHCIAKGMDVRLMMAELFARRDGYCKGLGGSMHIADIDRGVLGANGIVGGGIPIAAGAALAAKLRKSGQVAVCFFSDGAVNNGTFHESLNLASLWKLPAIYVVENNFYAQTTSTAESTAIDSVADRAAAYTMPGVVVDGNNVLDVYRKTKEAVDRARCGEGPSLLECRTYRWTGHHLNDPALYRPKEELAAWKEKDPIARLEAVLLSESLATTDDVRMIREHAEREVEEAVAFAVTCPELTTEEFFDLIDDGQWHNVPGPCKRKR
jgi:pyruvate dehydrogenase E1 component alpha subunit